MPEYLAPGVFVEETSFRSRGLAGVSTSVAGFVGPTLSGPTGRASSVLASLDDFEREYGAGAELNFADGSRAPHFVWHAARAFFANGGQRLHVARTWRDDQLPPEPSDVAAALEHLALVPDVAIVAAPGATFHRPHAGTAQALLAHVERLRYRIAVIDSHPAQSPGGIREMRSRLDSTRGAVYYPWVRVSDPQSGLELHVPPSGFVAGLYARVDADGGVHMPPAGEALHLAIGLERDFTRQETEELNQVNINLLRNVPGRGVLLWGSRALSADPEWKYVSVRRLLIFLEHSIDRGTEWAGFEPNAEPLWTNVRRLIEDFLHAQWQAGALKGATPNEAYFVKCDRTTMTQGDIDSGRLICLVGVAAVRPAEFVVFRVGQWTADRTGAL